MALIDPSPLVFPGVLRGAGGWHFLKFHKCVIF